MARHFEGREWKVETWLLSAPPSRPARLRSSIPEEARRTILGLKHARNAGQLKASGYEISEAVLLGGMREPAQVEEWLDRKKPQG